MKKIFTLAAAVLASFSLWAETESQPASATADKAIVGASYTIPGTYIAGQGGTQAGDMTSKGIKLRLNKLVGETEKAAEIKVNKGHKITKLEFCGHCNDKSKTATFAKVIVDGTDINATPVELPNKSSSISFSYNIEAEESIVFHFSGEGTQANLEYKVTYEVTATTYKATYKANNGTEDPDVVDDAALIVKDNMFEKKDAYFVGWNTKADGTGENVAVGADLSADIVLFAQWKDFASCISLALSGAEQTPAKDVEVLLSEGSEGGKIFFAGAKENKYEESFVCKEGKGVQLCKGAADSLRVELDKLISDKSVIRVDLIAVNNGSASINIISPSQKTIGLSIDANEGDAKSIYYIVSEEDGLADAASFRFQRSASVILSGFAISDCGKDVPMAIDNAEETVKAVKVIRNGQLLIEKNGVLFNAQGAVVK